MIYKVVFKLVKGTKSSKSSQLLPVLVFEELNMSKLSILVFEAVNLSKMSILFI